MEYESMGKFIQTLRKEKGLTQKQLADMLNITDKAVSKWERDVACPDTTTLPKLAEILGVTVESLLNAKAAQAPVENESKTVDDSNPDAQMYKERLRHHLIKGLPGFAIGFLFFLVTLFMFVTPSLEGGITFGSSLLTITIAFIAGLACAGIPYGWGLINKFLGQWTIFSNLFVVIFLFFAKFVFAYCIGLFSYPIVLIYNLIRSQKTKRRVKIGIAIIISAVILFYVFIGIAVNITAKSSAGASGTTDSTSAAVVQTVDVDSFSDQDALVNEVCQKALDTTKEEENDNVTHYGWTVTETTKLHGVFFLNAKDTENPHYNILKKLNVSNAIVVVTGYYLEEADPVSVNQWEMDVTVYPNFTFDDKNSLSYDTDSVYSHSLRSDDMKDLMEWLTSEYGDMNIQELSLS